MCIHHINWKPRRPPALISCKGCPSHLSPLSHPAGRRFVGINVPALISASASRRDVRPLALCRPSTDLYTSGWSGWQQVLHPHGLPVLSDVCVLLTAHGLRFGNLSDRTCDASWDTVHCRSSSSQTDRPYVGWVRQADRRQRAKSAARAVLWHHKGGGGGNRDVSVDDVMTPGAIFVDSRLSYCF